MRKFIGAAVLTAAAATTTILASGTASADVTGPYDLGTCLQLRDIDLEYGDTSSVCHYLGDGTYDDDWYLFDNDAPAPVQLSPAPAPDPAPSLQDTLTGSAAAGGMGSAAAGSAVLPEIALGMSAL